MAMQDVEAVLGGKAAARLWTGRIDAASAPHTRPAAALAATRVRNFCDSCERAAAGQVLVYSACWKNGVFTAGLHQ